MKFNEVLSAHAEYRKKSNINKFNRYKNSDVWAFKNLTEDTVRELIIGFLNKWGAYRIPYNIAPQLTRALLRVKSDIEYYKKKELWRDLTLDNEQRTHILRIFSELEQIKKIAGVGVAKILHMFCPNFFIMWDNSIAKNYGCWVNAQGYMNFLQITKNLIDENDLYTKFIQSKISDVTLLKLIDEFNMIRRH